MKNEKQREYFRLAYPDSYRPSLMVAAEDYEVEDISEYGVKVKVSDDLDFVVDDSVMAVISFPDGKEFDLSGQVVRVEEGYAGVQLETPLPVDFIRSEALYVMQNFPLLATA